MAVRLLSLLLCTLPLFAQEASHVDRFRPEADRYRQAVLEADAILQLEPNDVDALRRRAVGRLRLGELAAAEADLRRAVELDPESADLHADLGYVLWRRQEYSAALEAEQRAVQLDPEHPSANFYLGRLLLVTGADPSLAAGRLEKAVDLNPAETDIRFDLLTAYRALGDTVRAAAQLQILQAYHPPDEPRLLYAQGLVATDLGQLGRAVESFRRALDADPGLVGARFDLGMALIQLERWEEAARAFGEVARLQPESVEVAHLHALALFNARRKAQAQREVARGLTLDRDYGPLFALMGIMLAAEGENPRAVELLKRAVRLAPADFDSHFYLGRSHYALRNLEDALTAFQGALELQPAHQEARFFLATTLESLGRSEEAEVEYRRLLADHPADLEANVGLGALLVKRGDAEKALTLLRRAAGQAPDHFEAHLALGRALTQTDRLVEAIPPLRTAVRLRPDSTEAHYQLALALRRLGRLDEARQEFEIVKELNERNRGSGMGMGPPERKPEPFEQRKFQPFEH